MSAKRICRDALMTAAALLMFMIENLFPPLLAFAPGAKIGLSNVVTLITLILIGVPDAFIVLVARCVIGSLVTGNPFAVVYSLPAGLISLGLQTALYMTVFPRISLMAISLFGAIAHNIAQLAVATFIAGVNMFMLLPLMLAASVIAGLAVGFIAWLAVRLLPKSAYSGA